MREAICAELDEMEQTHGVRVLLAVESGSRVWGMASEDSDYDVRFVYVRPEADYLRLEDMRDTIEWKLDDTLDITGWDLRKYLRLMRNSNPSTFEWLASGIVYRESGDFSLVRAIATSCFLVKPNAHHYLGMAHENGKALLKPGRVSAKKYLYVTRALLSARWVLDEQTPAPPLLAELVDAKLDSAMRPHIDALLAAKIAGDEHCEVDHDAKLEGWIEAQQTELHELTGLLPNKPKPDWSELNRVFLEIVTG